MKKLCMLAALVGVCTALQASAMTVNATRIAGYYYGNGGEINLTSADAGFNAIVAGYDAKAKGPQGGLETFCIDMSTGLQNNPLNAAIVHSGVSSGVGYLYSQFAQGILTDYNYAPGVGRATSAWQLQNAIWALQGQTPVDAAAAAFFLTKSWFIGATGEFADLTAAEKILGVTSPYDVDKLDMWIGSKATGARWWPSQPMLVWNPHSVPDGGMTLMLLGFALGGLGLISRKIGI